MARRGRRSLAAQQRRYLNRVISRDAYRDSWMGESVNVYTAEQLLARLVGEFGVAVVPDVLKHERGEVVSDAYGRGSLQMYGAEESGEEGYVTYEQRRG